MDDLILIKSGSLNGRGAMPNLNYSSAESKTGSELGYRTDTKELYVGTKEGNVRLCGAGDLNEINAKIASVNALISTNNGKIAEMENTLAEIIARLDAMTPSE